MKKDMKQSYGFFIQWHLTDVCNLACRHCYQKGAKHPEMSTGRIAFFMRETRSTLREWSQEYDLDVRGSFQFTGGEPLLRRDLFIILETARENGFETFLMSNGTLINADMARQLKAVGVSAVQISLEGSPETHDSIRGAGSFKKAAAGVRLLAETDVDVTVNVTLSRLNLLEIECLVEKAADLGAKRIGFARLVPEGRGRLLKDEMLSPLEVRDAYQQIVDLNVPGIRVMTRDPISCLTDADDAGASCGNVAVAGCAAGLSGLTIMPDGTVMPCRRMNMGIGNINETSLRDIWATSPVLNNLRERSLYPGVCGECDKWDVCRGCRAVAYAVSKAEGVPDYLADDPQCWKD